MTREELKEFNGKDGKPVYIAYKGKVYDLSKSDFWTGGLHMGLIEAGTDVTEKISMSPHGEVNIFRYNPPIADLEDAEGTSEAPAAASSEAPASEAAADNSAQAKMAARIKWYQKNHPHPKMTHFPIGIFFLCVITQFIGIFVGDPKFVFYASLVPFIIGTVLTTGTIGSGLLSFYINYNLFLNPLLKRKIILATLLMLVAIVGIILGYLELGINPNANEVVTNSGYTVLSSLYSLCVLAVFLLSMAIGVAGGKLTWPDNK